VDNVENITLPSDASGDEILEALIEQMESQSLAERFDEFVTTAVMTEDELDELPEVPTEADLPGFYVIARVTTVDIGAQLDVKGIVISIWPAEEREYTDDLPADLDKDRHCRFLTVSDEGLIDEMYLLPKYTLH
jgi:hypothetical protein